MSFSPGDQVKLKSGGPIMTVEKVRGDAVTCVWFDGKKAHDRKFLAATLEVATLEGADEVGEMPERLKEEATQKTDDAVRE